MTVPFADVAHFVIADMQSALNGGGRKMLADYIRTISPSRSRWSVTIRRVGA